MPEAAAGVIELVGLGMAARQEGFIQRDGASGLGWNELIDYRRYLLKPAHEREALAVANERSGAEGGFDLPFDWISPWLRFHPAFASFDRFQSVCHKRFNLRADWQGAGNTAK
jgi:hypothetical protein